MITSSVHHDENEDEDLDMLRKIAMESLKRGRENEFVHEQSQPDHQFQNIQPMFVNQPPEMPIFENEMPFQNNAFPLARPRLFRPRFMGNFPPRHHVRPFMAHRMPLQFPPRPVIPDFIPIPHVNPTFLAHQPPPQPQIFPANDFNMEYAPIPHDRLSPRSREFVAANDQAIKNSSSKRYSPPRRRRSRTRSPYKRKSPNNDNIRNKRYRSKSPENRVYKSRNNSPKAVEKRSKSPQNRSQSPTRNSRYSHRGRDSRYNGNGRYNRKRSDSENEDDSNKNEHKRSQSKPKEDASVKEKVKIVEKEKLEEKKDDKHVVDQINQSLTPPIEPEKSTTPPLKPERKEKTLEELEDELLASTDEEGDQLDINMDADELDFLNDDSESENEGRFKSKPSSNAKTTSQPSKGSYTSKSYDKGKSTYSSSRNDYKRDDRYNSKRKNYGSRKMSPETYEPRRKSPVERKIHILNKDKDEPKSSTESERKPMFKSTFKSIESGEKKGESTAPKKSETRVALVRSFVSKPEIVEKKTSSSSSVKSVITTSEETAVKTGKKKIMERLGEFVGTKGKIDGNRSRATKQVIERRKYILEMKINQAVESNNMASRNTYVAI